MSEIVLHHVPQSRSQRVLWLLRELRLEHEVRVWPFDKTLRSAEYLALNPVGRVPALEMDGRAYWETGAIIELLCERFPDARLGRGAAEAERADFLIWLHFAETMSQHAAALTQQHLMLRDAAMRSPVVCKLEAARVGKCFDAVEMRLAREGTTGWLLAEFSAADIAVAQAAIMARRFHRVGARGAMVDWLARCEARPAFPVEEGLYDREFYEVPA
ncbi:maleylacetoacetate isomerase [Jannaschia seosinensis]|uniref:Maleylacetoacetate isomerase n=1 Tax=Jannaschia seosinensis TaxID=313367 RepID=A0A0M7B7C4_9RHOB|nr:glutathione S-transferase [Jannaschia seosinensis]CUH32900.1 maleylacetoacetate isomerase [Jannaschia seosinensis]